MANTWQRTVNGASGTWWPTCRPRQATAVTRPTTNRQRRVAFARDCTPGGGGGAVAGATRGRGDDGDGRRPRWWMTPTTTTTTMWTTWMAEIVVGESVAATEATVAAAIVVGRPRWTTKPRAVAVAAVAEAEKRRPQTRTWGIAIVVAT